MIGSAKKAFSTADFNYELPEELIAQLPMANRSDSRLLLLDRASAQITDHQFPDIIDHLQPNDLLVLNNTKVIPARLYGQKASGGKLEALVERVTGEHTALLHIKCSKSPKPGSDVFFVSKIDVNDATAMSCSAADTGNPDIADAAFVAEVVGRDGALFNCRFERPVMEVLAEIGEIPLPPYIERTPDNDDSERYQTVFAKHEGAVAAPTASLHFTDELLALLREKGVKTTELTLHVGAGTFQPVRVDNIADHHMHSEVIDVPESAVQAIRACRESGGRVFAVGTTVVRSLESAARECGVPGELAAYQGETNIFITPGFPFQVVDGLLTNFHLPESTLIMLVSAFAGYDLTMAAYQHAVRESYRFFSYGDAMLILS